MKFLLNFRSQTLYLLFLTVLLPGIANSQVCDKKTSIFFESGKFSVNTKEEGKLIDLSRQFSLPTDTFLLELYAFTDSVASEEYNLKLAGKRLKTILNYLKKNSPAHFVIREKVRGEATPQSSNLTEEGRAKNRRVDIFYFKIGGGMITLRGGGGMEMSVSRNYFEPCGVCECNTRMTEIFTNQQASQAGIRMLTADSCPLVTAGMISVVFTGESANNCSDVIIRIPADKFDDQMEIWGSTTVNQQGGTMSAWARRAGNELEFDEKAKLYILKVRYCPGDFINIDKLSGMSLNRVCRDSAGVISVPELNRFKINSRFRIVNSTVRTKEGKKDVTLAKFAYRGRGDVLFTDSGMTEGKIGYYFSGSILPYKGECDSARCERLKECWCYDIPLSEYTKLIYFQKKRKYRLIVPRKFRNYQVRLYIPAGDTLIPITNLKGSMRKYSFQQPLPAAYMVLYKKNEVLKNRLKYDYQLDLDKIPVKYNKRKKYYKAKIKRSQLQDPV